MQLNGRVLPADGGASSHSERWGLLALLMAASAANQLHRISLPAVGKQVMEAYGFTHESLGFLFSVFIWTYTLFMIPGGVLADRAGTWWTLTLVLLGSSLFGAATGGVFWVVPTAAAVWWWIAACRAAMGVLSAPLYPSTARTVASWFHPRQRAFANSMVTGAALLGIAGAQELMSYLSRAIGWRSAFFVAGAVSLAVLIAWMVFGRAAPGSRHGDRPGGSLFRREAWGWLRCFCHPGVLALTLSYAAVGYFEYMFFYWSKLYFEDVLKLPEAVSARYASFPNLAMMVMTPIGGVLSVWAVRRHGHCRGLRGVAMIAMALAALFLAAGALVANIETKVALFALALGSIGASEGPFWTAAVHLGGRHGAACGGFVNTGGNLLGALAPTVTPIIAIEANRAWAEEGSQLGWTVALLAGAAVTLAGVSCWLWVDVEKPLA